LKAWGFGNLLDKCAAARLNRDGGMMRFELPARRRAPSVVLFNHKITLPARALRARRSSFGSPAGNHRIDCDAQGVRPLPEHRPFRP
jgi:hypothetical protein